MTSPITPNPAIHVQPKDIGAQQELFTAGQLQTWAQELPLAMTLDLVDAILRAFGANQSQIDAINAEYTTYYDNVQAWLSTYNTNTQTLITALQADATASTAAFATFITAVEAAISGYTNWTTFITAIEAAWVTYSTTESGLLSSAIFTLQNFFNTALGISPSTGQMNAGNVANVLGGASLGADVTAVHTASAALTTEFNTANAAFATLVSSWYTTLTTTGQTWSAVLTALDSAWTTYLAANSAVNVSVSATITQLLSSIGFDPTTGFLASDNVAGLNDSFTQLGAAVSGDVADAGDWAWLAQITNEFYTMLGITHNTAVANANTIAIVDNKPIIYGLDSTTESSIAFTDAVNTINVTSSATLFGFVRCSQTDTKNTIAFTASTSSAPTGFYVNLYLADFTNSILHYINTSANLVSQLTSSEKWLFTTAGATSVQPGSVLAVEFQVVGSGSVNVYGQTITGKPTHPTAVLPGAGATRSSVPGGSQSLLAFSGLGAPGQIAVDSLGAVYVADNGNNRIVQLAGGVQTVLGFSGLSGPRGVTVDSSGAVYVADTANNRVVKLSGGTQTVLGFTGLSGPRNVAVDSAGAVYAVDQGNNRVVKLSGGTQSVLGFTGLSAPWGIAVDSAGAVYVGDTSNNRVVKLSGGTQTALGFTGLSAPWGVAVDSSGNVYAADFGNNRVVKLAGGTQSVVGFSGLSGPHGVAVDAVGNVYVADGTDSKAYEYSNDTAFTHLSFNNTGIPYVGLETSSPPAPMYPDHSLSYTITGTTTQTLDSWAVFVDLIVLGGGGGGEGETGAGNGPGGCAGGWNTQTLTVGTDIPVGGTLTITVGGGGAGGPYFTPGSPGVATTISWHDPSGTLHTLTGAAGLAGNATNNLTSWGLGPGNKTFPASGPHSQTYIGGATNSIGGVGNVPGAGGTGGAAFQYGFAGARGQAWTVERQT